MDLRENIEQQLKKDFDLLNQYEDDLRDENDPGQRSKCNRKIEQIKQQIINRQQELQNLPQPSTTTVVNQSLIEDLGFDVKLEMVYIPGGTFLMGAPESEEGSRDSERPQHYVTVKPFYMGKYTITQEQWEKVVYSCPTVERELKPHPAYFKGDKLPVEKVSWYDAVEFCARLSKKTGRQYRLPSEAEWEYACRAGSAKPFSFGDTITTDVVNCKGSYGQTTEVGTFPPNAFGLYDMHGNVWEWCADNWNNNYENASNNGNAWLDKNNESAILRGGSWDDIPEGCRSACRDGDHRDGRCFNIGFRVVCVVGRTFR